MFVTVKPEAKLVDKIEEEKKKSDIFRKDRIVDDEIFSEQSGLNKDSFGNSYRKYANAPPNITSLPIVALTPTKKGRNPPLRNMSIATVKNVFFLPSI